MSELNAKQRIAKRIAMLFNDGELVNLGVGVPTLIPGFLPEGVEVWLESENGIIGAGPVAAPGNEDFFCKDAGDQYCTILPGGSTFNSADSFGLIRGGHLAATVLGALQVDQHGNLANWVVPGGRMNGMGGAMDLVQGARQVIIATEHCAKDGSPKILAECTFPLTGAGVVDLIVTELAYMQVTDEGLVLAETAPGVSVDEVIANTDAPLIISDQLREMPI